MTNKQKALVWFRQDLRVKDNPALEAACEYKEVLPVYIIDEDMPERAEIGGASAWWLHCSLTSLASSLDNNLLIIKGNASAVIHSLVEEHGIDAVFWNRQYEDWQIERDSKIKNSIKEQGKLAVSFNGTLLWEPMKILKKDKTPYKVFTPYYRKGCLVHSQPRLPVSSKAPNAYLPLDYEFENKLNTLKLLPQINWYSDFSNHWEPGEVGASKKLANFIENACLAYQDGRNIPSKRGTSQLSPHLHFGEISPNQVWYAVLDAFDGNTEDKNIDVFLSELGWREFSHYLLYHWPNLHSENFNAKFNKFPWRKDDKELKAWQFGNTGIPIIDAGMRELYQTGYMHNRVRMIAGSFLVKNLLIDWREGERWFWDCLLDADTAANSASWQWVAGSGADAAPYFRVFNPILQGEKFDKEGEYVKRYCPELSKLPPKFIHKPWEAPSNILNACSIVLGKNYPKPIVDLKTSRQRALDAFSEIKGN